MMVSTVSLYIIPKRVGRAVVTCNQPSFTYLQGKAKIVAVRAPVKRIHRKIL